MYSSRQGRFSLVPRPLSFFCVGVRKERGFPTPTQKKESGLGTRLGAVLSGFQKPLRIFPRRWVRPFSATRFHEAYTAGLIAVLLAFVSTRSFLIATKENWIHSQKFVLQRHWKLCAKIPPYAHCKSPRQIGCLETNQRNL